METDCVSGSSPQKVPPGQKISVAIERESQTTFARKNVISFGKVPALELHSTSLTSDDNRLFFW